MAVSEEVGGFNFPTQNSGQKSDHLFLEGFLTYNVVYIFSIVYHYISVAGEDLSIAETVSQVTEVRLTSAGGLGKTNH